MTFEPTPIAARGAYEAAFERWRAVLECLTTPSARPRGLQAAHHVARVAQRNTIVRECVRVAQVIVEYAGVTLALALSTVHDRDRSLFVALAVLAAVYFAVNVAVELPWLLMERFGLARLSPPQAWQEDVVTGAVLLILITATFLAAVMLPMDPATRALLVIGTGGVVAHLALLAVIERGAWAVRHRQMSRDVELGVADPLVNLLDDLAVEGSLTDPAVAHSAGGLLELAAETIQNLSRSVSLEPGGSFLPWLPKLEEAAAALEAASRRPPSPSGAAIEILEVEVRELATALLLDVLGQGSTPRADVAAHPPATDCADPSRVESALVWVSRTLRSNDSRSDAIAAASVLPKDAPRQVSLPARGSRSVSRMLAWAVAVVISILAVLRADWTSTPDLPQLAAFVATCGIAAMMVLESAKALFPLRALHHRRHLLRWLTDRLGDQDGEDAGRELIALLNAGPRSRSGGRRSGFTSSVAESLFNLPPELFLAQVSLAIDRALAARDRRAPLVEAFAPAAAHDPDDDTELPLQLAASFNQLQAWLAESWRLAMRVMSWILSGLVALVAVTLFDVPAEGSSLYVLATLAFGGIVAGLSRDVLAAIERLRRR